MPRRHFVADLQAAQETRLPDGFSDLRPGEEDGSFNITYKTPGFGSQLVHLQAQVTDVGDYPSDHQYFVYSTSDHVPEFVNEILSDPSIFSGLNVKQVVGKIAKNFDDRTRGTSQNPVSLDSDDNEADLWDYGDEDETMEPYDNEDESDADDDFDDDFGLAADFSFQQQTTTGGVTNAALYATREATEAYNLRIRDDLRRVKAAGFRVSCCTSPFDFARDFYMTVSCRIAKLNISEDALDAWGLTREKYIIMIFHYTDGYKTFEEVMAEAKLSRNTVSFRVAVSTKHKGPKHDTINAFSTAFDQQPAPNASTESHETSGPLEGNLEKFFIDRPLNELMNKRFVNITRMRLTHSLSWDGAERYFQDNQAMGPHSNLVDESYLLTPERVTWRTHPSLLVDDHLATGGNHKSFPMVAMEFMLRHLVQCTEFCLVCHTKLDTNFEALKPYVCSKPLCLYQYMALGFGPSMEHEILSQPYVVDLLISFCYFRAQAGKLEDFPLGMGLSVPHPQFILPLLPGQSTSATSPATDASKVQIAQSHGGKLQVLFDESKQQLTFPENSINPNINSGDWVILEYYSRLSSGESVTRKLHRKVAESWFPVIRLVPGPEAPLDLNNNLTPPVTGGSGIGIEALIFPFHYKFDDCTPASQQAIICNFLNVLPTVSQMKAALSVNRSKSLAQIYTDISPASLGILRWIIASNRSCIVAIDDPTSNRVNTNERVYGMPGYMQFRFAQGAPDKEQRFMSAVQEKALAVSKRPPTLWAWHGSGLDNWHSIIREGLHYKSVVHGRAYGDGIYNALDAHTSMGYSSSRAVYYQGQPKAGWPKSKLNITSALSLNEIVNSPSDFRSSSPYLVVPNVDWVQTRILCVECNLPKEEMTHLDDAQHKKPRLNLEQDTKFSSKGINSAPLVIPVNAISASRRTQLGLSSPSRLKKLKTMVTGSELHDEVEEALMSDASDDEDRALFEEPRSVQVPAVIIKKSATNTDFVPGSLDLTKLPRLPDPPYATPQASKALGRALKELQQIQNSSPTADLGWHLCEDALDNIYQWIVELHTFDPNIPLHKDLKSKGLTSVVLELRFGPQFPYSPPFVRVIRPRFLGFQQGGGGHVTAGGAMCMELLTNDGWSAVSSIEAVLLQVKMAISSMDPKPARLPQGPVGEYHAAEAIEAYKRACMVHGWKIPADFAQIASAGAGSSVAQSYLQNNRNSR